MAPSVVLGLATILTAGALLMVALSFATDNWTEYIVNRESLRAAVSYSDLSMLTFNSRAYYFSRHRGLFRECFNVKPTANETACKFSFSHRNVLNCGITFNGSEKHNGKQKQINNWVIFLLNGQ